MYREIYHQKKVTISAVQILTVMIVVSFAYVLPVYIFTAYQTQQASVYTADSLKDRQVAGVSTSKDAKTGQVTLNFFGTKLQLPTETSMLLVAGTGLTAVGCILMIGLIFTRRQQEIENLEHPDKIS